MRASRAEVRTSGWTGDDLPARPGPQRAAPGAGAPAVRAGPDLRPTRGPDRPVAPHTDRDRAGPHHRDTEDLARPRRRPRPRPRTGRPLRCTLRRPVRRPRATRTTGLLTPPGRVQAAPTGNRHHLNRRPGGNVSSRRGTGEREMRPAGGQVRSWCGLLSVSAGVFTAMHPANDLRRRWDGAPVRSHHPRALRVAAAAIPARCAPRRAGPPSKSSSGRPNELFSALGGDEGEERAARGTVLELSVEAVGTQAPSVRCQQPVQLLDLLRRLPDTGRGLRMDGSCQEGEQHLVRSAGELQPRVLEDPVVGQVVIVKPVLLYIGADSREPAVLGRRSVQVVEALQERDLVQLPPPGARYPAQVVEDVAPRHRRDRWLRVCRGGVAGRHASRMKGRAVRRRSVGAFHLLDGTSGGEAQRGSGAVGDVFGVGAVQSAGEGRDGFVGGVLE